MDKKSNSEVINMLESVSIQDLLSTIRKKAKTGCKDIATYIRMILQGSTDKSDASQNRCFETFKCGVALLQLKDLPQNVASEITSILLMKVDCLQTSNLVKLAEIFIASSNEHGKFGTKLLEIFSNVLTCLGPRDSIVYQGVDMSGCELRKKIVNSLFCNNTDTQSLIQFAAVIKDVDLSEDEKKLVIQNLLEALPNIELAELPPFIYQLFLISSNGQYKIVIPAVLTYFIEKDRQIKNDRNKNVDSEDLIGNDEHIQFRQVEGTTILMISVVCRHDQDVAKVYILLLKKMMYKPESILSSFIFSTALTLSKICRNSDEIFDILKKSMLIAFQVKQKKQLSLWLRMLIQRGEDVLDLVSEAIKSSRYGWDHVCQGLVKFGFVCLDSFGPRIIAGNAIKTVCPEACSLGAQILIDTFKSHQIVRHNIFEQVLNRIITKSQKPVSHYIDILAQIVQTDTLFLLDVLPKVVEVLDYLHFLPHSNAASLLQSLAPLLKISAPLKDTLMLVLRKGLFHRDIEARKVAITGYLTILKRINFIGKVSLSQSQISVGSHASSSSMISTQVKADCYVSAGNPTSKTMCLEIMGLLKGALMQPAEIKQVLYEDLYDVVLHNSSLKEIVLELLLAQFEKNYNINESELPFDFDMCFHESKNTKTLTEPLAHLITSIYLILLDGSSEVIDDDYDQSPQKILNDLFQNLIKRMLTIDVAEFHICKDAEGDESSAEMMSKIHLISNVYESLLEYSFVRNAEFAKEGCEEFLGLYEKYREVINLASKKKQTKSKSSLAPSLFSHVTFNFISKALKAVFADQAFKHQEGLQLLRRNSSLVMNLVTACNQKLCKMADTGACDRLSQAMKIRFDIILGKVYIKSYCDGADLNLTHIDWDKLSFLLAEGIDILFKYMNSPQQTRNFSKFIVDICDEEVLSTKQALQFIVKSIQKSVMELLSDTDDEDNIKQCIPLLSALKTLYLVFKEDFESNIYVWVKQLCSQQVFQDVLVSKAFISLCLTVGHQHENLLELMKDLAFDLHYHLGHIDPDDNVRGTPKYEIITSDTAKHILPIILGNLEICFDEIEWVLNYIKSNADDNSDEICTIEEGLCIRVSNIILIFYEIVQTSVAESTANSILKLVSRFYKLLTTFTKYYLLLHKNSVTTLHPEFQKLVKTSNTKLTAQVYAFITFIQMLSGGNNCNNDNNKKKAKGSSGAFKAVQDVKIIPSLVFEIESYEKNLIILSKKYKVDLTNKMKQSTARDFRINASAITSMLLQQENSLDSTAADNAMDEENQQVDAPAQNDSSKDKSDISIDDSPNEAPNEMPVQGEEPVNISQNVFGEEVVPSPLPSLPANTGLVKKRKRLGIGHSKK